jgi:ATP-binding cassette, subfamily B (MDR/TAP), member 1
MRDDAKGSSRVGDCDTKSASSLSQSGPYHASVSDTLSFIFMGSNGGQMRIVFALGLVAGIANGLVYPALAFLFSASFSDLGSAAEGQGISRIRDLAYMFMAVGTGALVAAAVQGLCFEICAYHGTSNFRLSFFSALLRQDPAYFDVHDISGLSAQIGPASTKYRRGIGRKLGEVSDM